MGSWGAGIFESDAALDFLDDLEEGGGTRQVREVLDDVLRTPAAEIVVLGEQALVAGCLVAIGAGQEPLDRGPAGRQAHRWVAAHPEVGEPAMVVLAEQAVERIATDSELRELMHERDGDDWDRIVAELLSRLRAAGEHPRTPLPAPPDTRVHLVAGDVIEFRLPRFLRYAQVLLLELDGDEILVLRTIARTFQQRPTDLREVVRERAHLYSVGSPEEAFAQGWAQRIDSVPVPPEVPKQPDLGPDYESRATTLRRPFTRRFGRQLDAGLSSPEDPFSDDLLYVLLDDERSPEERPRRWWIGLRGWED